MSHQSETPFDNIENSHQYVALLADAIAEAQADVDAQIALAGVERAERRLEALQLVSYNLTRLNTHILTSRRILNDLRSLRRLLLEERTLPYAARRFLISGERTRKISAKPAQSSIRVRTRTNGGHLR